MHTNLSSLTHASTTTSATGSSSSRPATPITPKKTSSASASPMSISPSQNTDTKANSVFKSFASTSPAKKALFTTLSASIPVPSLLSSPQSSPRSQTPWNSPAYQNTRPSSPQVPNPNAAAKAAANGQSLPKSSSQMSLSSHSSSSTPVPPSNDPSSPMSVEVTDESSSRSSTPAPAAFGPVALFTSAPPKDTVMSPVAQKRTIGMVPLKATPFKPFSPPPYPQ